MMYFGVTQRTADWLLGKAGLLDALHHALCTDLEEMKKLSVAELVDGPFRMSATTTFDLLIAWNIDYLSGTGEESWGFIRIEGEASLRARAEMSREFLERSLHVINQRLQGLFLDGSLIHRAYPNGAHTCTAGRSTARQWNMGYYERTVDGSSPGQHGIVCIGPEYDFAYLSREAAKAGESLDRLSSEATALIAPGRKRTVITTAYLPELRRILGAYTRGEERQGREYSAVEIATDLQSINDRDAYRAIGIPYSEWISDGSPLSEVQRRILLSDAIEHHPLRIIGPGGSGKTLLMQLLAMRRLANAKDAGLPLRILYIVHNAAMADMVKNRFSVLEADEHFRDAERVLDICTLAEYGREQLGLDYTAIIDPDAYMAKQFQLEQVSAGLVAAMEAMPNIVEESKLFSEAKSRPELMSVLARLIMAEISGGIKGHGLEFDKRRYVQSERPLSRLHGVLTTDERMLVYHVYEWYHNTVFEEYEVLDTDDIALSLLGRLRTPIWELKRRKLGYDYVFVDETQLFNENERRVLPLLTNNSRSHVPIVLALDEAQDVYGHASAGLSTLGIPDIANENLASIHRSTRAIVKLAFFVIQRSTDLFGPDFPDFTGIAERMEPDTHPLAMVPRIEIPADQAKLGRIVIKRIREMRRAKLRRIAVICHAEQYWDTLHEELSGSDLPVQVVLQRGERLPSDQPVVVLTRPLYAGGQEFDGVLLVGLEQGVVPPRVTDNDALASAVEQQSMREIYLAITRARYRTSVVLSPGASLTAVLAEAERAGLLERRVSSSTTD